MGALLAAVVAMSAAATVSVRTNKRIVIPGADASAELLVVAQDAAPDARLDLTATAGKVTGVRALGDGRFQATFVPPQGAPPVVAFVTARVTSGERTDLGLAAIAVHGAATVETDVAPGTPVAIDAGGRAFGPFTPDGRGHLRASIVVPPRLKEVTLRQGSADRVVPLELPPVSLVHAAIAGEASHGHGEEPLVVDVLAVDRTGYPAWKPAPRLSADRGEATPQGPKAPGVFRWTFEAPASPGGGEAKLTARIPEDPASVASLEVKLRPPRPEAPAAVGRKPAGAAGLALRLSGQEVVAGDRGEVTVEVLLGGRALTPAELAAASIEADVGTVVPAYGGMRWVLPSSFGGKTAAAIRANVGSEVAEERVALVAGPPAVGRIAFDEAKARGGRAVGARLTLADAHRNPVSGARPIARAPRGEAGAVTEEAPGVYRFSYTPPDVKAPETEQLEVEVAGGLVVPAPPLPVVPRLSGLGVAVGVMVGGHSNLARAWGGTPSGEVAVRLPALPLEVVARVDRAFYLDAQMALGGSGSRQVVRYGGPGGEIGARASLPVGPWLGVHAAASAVGRQVEATLVVRGGPADGATETSSAFSLGAAAAAGLSVRAGPGRFVLEGGFAWLPGQGVLRGNLAGWGARAGFLLELL